jgi:hypothetical protein
MSLKVMSLVFKRYNYSHYKVIVNKEIISIVVVSFCRQTFLLRYNTQRLVSVG